MYNDAMGRRIGASMHALQKFFGNASSPRAKLRPHPGSSRALRHTRRRAISCPKTPAPPDVWWSTPFFCWDFVSAGPRLSVALFDASCRKCWRRAPDRTVIFPRLPASSSSSHPSLSFTEICGLALFSVRFDVFLLRFLFLFRRSIARWVRALATRHATL